MNGFNSLNVNFIEGKQYVIFNINENGAPRKQIELTKSSFIAKAQDEANKSIDKKELEDRTKNRLKEMEEGYKASEVMSKDQIKENIKRIKEKEYQSKLKEEVKNQMISEKKKELGEKAFKKFIDNIKKETSKFYKEFYG